MKQTNQILSKIVNMTRAMDELELYTLCAELVCSYDSVQNFAVFRIDKKHQPEVFSFEYTSNPVFVLPEQNIIDILNINNPDKCNLLHLSRTEDIKVFFSTQFTVYQTVFILQYSHSEHYLNSSEEDEIHHLSSLLELAHNHVSVLHTSERDVLTGLLNRQSYNKRINSLLLHIQNNRRDSDGNKILCLCIMDIDHFKRVNDNYGHLIGDEVLLHFAQVTEKCFRHEDLVFRFGGEEFIALLQGVTKMEAEIAIERLRGQIENYVFPNVGQVTVSIGATQVIEIENSEHLMEKADRSLYYVKQNGRNNYAFYEDLISEGKIEEVATTIAGDTELF